MPLANATTYQETLGLDLWRVEKPCDGFTEDHKGNDNKKQPIHEAREDLHTTVPETMQDNTQASIQWHMQHDKV